MRHSGLFRAFPYALALAFAVVLMPAMASAAPRPRRVGVHLEYDRGANVRQCPEESEMRGEVAAEMGFDPFTKAGPWRFHVAILRRKNGMFVAKGQLFDSGGATFREMPELVHPDCRYLVTSAVAAWIALVLTDPPLPPPAAPPQPPVAALRSPPPPDGSAPKRPTTDPFLVVIGLGSTFGFGAAPRAAAGVTADVGFHWKVDAAPLQGVSLTLGVRWDPPASSPPLEGSFGGVRVVTSRVVGTVAPCGHWWKLYGCVVGELGKLRHHYEDRIAYPVDGIHDLYAAMGGRIGIEVPFAPHVGFRGFAEVLGTTTPVVA